MPFFAAIRGGHVSGGCRAVLPGPGWACSCRGGADAGRPQSPNCPDRSARLPHIQPRCEKRLFLSSLYIQTRSFCQDRLGTNIGKVEKTRRSSQARRAPGPTRRCATTSTEALSRSLLRATASRPSRIASATSPTRMPATHSLR